MYQKQNFLQYKINFLKVSIHTVSCKQSFKISIRYKKHSKKWAKESWKALTTKIRDTCVQQECRSNSIQVLKKSSKVFKCIKPQILWCSSINYIWKSIIHLWPPDKPCKKVHRWNQNEMLKNCKNTKITKNQILSRKQHQLPQIIPIPFQNKMVLQDLLNPNSGTVCNK